MANLSKLTVQVNNTRPDRLLTLNVDLDGRLALRLVVRVAFVVSGVHGLAAQAPSVVLLVELVGERGHAIPETRLVQLRVLHLDVVVDLPVAQVPDDLGLGSRHLSHALDRGGRVAGGLQGEAVRHLTQVADRLRLLWRRETRENGQALK